MDRKILSVISYVGCGISFVALILTLLTYSCFRLVSVPKTILIIVYISSFIPKQCVRCVWLEYVSESQLSIMCLRKIYFWSEHTKEKTFTHEFSQCIFPSLGQLKILLGLKDLIYYTQYNLAVSSFSSFICFQTAGCVAESGRCYVMITASCHQQDVVWRVEGVMS